MEKELERVVSRLKFFWDRWQYHICRTEDLKALDDTNYVFSEYAAKGYKEEYTKAFEELTEYLEEQDDARSIIDVLDSYDCLRSRSGDRNLSA